MNVPIWIKEWYKIFLVICTPIVLIPILIVFDSDASKCAYGVLILLIYWIFEAIPIPVTSLLPIVLFPLLGILKATEVANNYFKDTTAFFFGSITLAYAMQQVNLHRRVALFVLTHIGSSPKWTMAGLMFTTYLISMWVNNAASTSIMLPVALAIAGEYELYTNNTSNENENDSQPTFNRALQLKKGLILCVTYGSVYGGLSTIVGSAATIFLKGFVDEQFSNTNFRITFLNYLLLAVPTTILMMITCWLWLQIRYNRHEFVLNIRCRWKTNLVTIQREKHLKETLQRQYDELGPLRWNELIIAGMFLLAITLWITRDLANGSAGWSRLFRANFVSNGTVALFISILTMIIPNEKPRFKNWQYSPIISWPDLSKNFPWSSLTILGAGLSIAQAFQVSKLSDLLGSTLHFVHRSPYVVILITTIILSEICTQFINNLSIASILFPIISTLSKNTQTHPARLIIPSTLALSLSFLLPISSQPNSIVFATGHIRSSDFLQTGFMLNILGGLIIFLASTTWMIPLFDLNQTFLAANLTIDNSTLVN